MPPKKKLGYNWRARQHKRSGFRNNQELLLSSDFPLVELESSATEYVGARVDDSNVLVLPSKRKGVDSSESERTPKRKKLSGKQRKRLQKIIEAKEKKARVSVLIKKHCTWVLICVVIYAMPCGSQLKNKALEFNFHYWLSSHCERIKSCLQLC